MFPPRQEHDADSSIRQTDNDAALAKVSAVAKGYLKDPFIKYFVPRAHLQPPRPPLINIGTFVRTAAIDQLVEKWIDISAQSGTECQVVSLGAGSDTRFWRLATGTHRHHIASYVEIDFPEITSKKAMAIRKSKELSAVLGEASIASGGTALHSSKYHLVPADLRMAPSETLDPALVTNQILSPTLPTLLIFECVLVYMSPDASSALLQWFLSYFARPGGGGALGSIVYEMFGLGDSFGRVMMNNLRARNVTLPGAEPYPDRASLPSRFLSMGYTSADALTLRDIRRACLEVSEAQRIAKLEMLDEVEELELVLDHYAITWGVWKPERDGDRWKEWKLTPKAIQQGTGQDD